MREKFFKEERRYVEKQTISGHQSQTQKRQHLRQDIAHDLQEYLDERMADQQDKLHSENDYSNHVSTSTFSSQK